MNEYDLSYVAHMIRRDSLKQAFCRVFVKVMTYFVLRKVKSDCQNSLISFQQLLTNIN